MAELVARRNARRADAPSRYARGHAGRRWAALRRFDRRGLRFSTQASRVRRGPRHRPRAHRPRSGLGFGKRANTICKSSAQLRRFVEIGPPLLVGASRKRFLGAVLGVDDPKLRDTGFRSPAPRLSPSPARRSFARMTSAQRSRFCESSPRCAPARLRPGISPVDAAGYDNVGDQGLGRDESQGKSEPFRIMQVKLATSRGFCFGVRTPLSWPRPPSASTGRARCRPGSGYSQQTGRQAAGTGGLDQSGDLETWILQGSAHPDHTEPRRKPSANRDRGLQGGGTATCVLVKRAQDVVRQLHDEG